MATARASSPRPAPLPTAIDFTDFYAYMPTHQYLYVPTRELWSTTSVDSRLPRRDGVKASVWLDQERHVEQMTWCPGKPMVMPDTLVSDGGWISHNGATCYNLYRPPLLVSGTPALAAPWVDHVRLVYPDDAEHMLAWFAQRVQRPHEKINHALVLGGNQGIGKDTILEPIKHAIGPWNFAEISPSHMMGRFNGFAKSVILRINEARDLGEVDRFSFYDHTKTFTAAPPDVLRVDEKNLREHAIFNVCGVVITSNYKTGIYLDPDDRRHYVAWSGLSKEDFPGGYFAHLYDWFEHGGLAHVAAYLAAYDLTTFAPKRPPRQTDAWRDIVDASKAPEDADMLDVLERLCSPDAVTLQQLADPPTEKGFSAWLTDPKNRRSIPHRLHAAGYDPTRNPWAKDGFWVVNSRRQMIYTKYVLPQDVRLTAAQALTGAGIASF